MKLKIALPLLCLFLTIALSYAQVIDPVLPKKDVKGNAKRITKKDVEVTFRVRWDGRVIPDICKISDLVRKTEVIKNRNGADPSMCRRSPGLTQYKPITIQRPRSKDKEFERWANKVWNFGAGLGSEVSLEDFRKDIIIEMCGPNDRVLMAFKVYRCWPSEYVALSDMDREDADPAMEVLILQHEGWERDYDVQ